MKKDGLFYLKHIVDAMTLIKSYLENVTIDEFMKNRMLQDAVGNIIPWNKMVGMRNKLINEYFGVVLNAV